MDILSTLIILVVTFITTAVFGIVPPVLVGLWTWKMAKRGQKDAEEMRDLALAKVQSLEEKLANWALPESSLEKIRISINSTIDGKIGNIIKQARSEVQSDPGSALVSGFVSMIKGDKKK